MTEAATHQQTDGKFHMFRTFMLRIKHRHFKGVNHPADRINGCRPPATIQMPAVKEPETADEMPVHTAIPLRYYNTEENHLGQLIQNALTRIPPIAAAHTNAPKYNSRPSMQRNQTDRRITSRNQQLGNHHMIKLLQSTVYLPIYIKRVIHGALARYSKNHTQHKHRHRKPHADDPAPAPLFKSNGSVPNYTARISAIPV